MNPRPMNADLTVREGREETQRTRKIQKEGIFLGIPFASFAKPSRPLRPEVRSRISQPQP